MVVKEIKTAKAQRTQRCLCDIFASLRLCGSKI
jgi:hypothetical protein